jgi:hypothetical protein
MRITLCENMRAVPYVPFYLALAGGYWESEGLDIRHVLSPSTPRTATALLDGAVDVSWGGPMRVMMHHDADARCPLVCFGQVVARDPFLLVGRNASPPSLAIRRPAPPGRRRADALVTFRDDRGAASTRRRSPGAACGRWRATSRPIAAARWTWSRFSSPTPIAW